MPQYTQLVLTELRSRAPFVTEKKVSSIYFGGGTPSLLPAADILAIRREIANVGFEIASDAEVTIEINPGTINQEKLDLYLEAGVNRFSVGVQTFNDALLRACGREHSADDSRRTLQFLAEHKLNYSFDLLFGLPSQTTAALAHDLDELLTYSPPHVSLYNLTVPNKHPMNRGRESDEVQAEMFNIIERELARANIQRYEVSNFAKAGFEAKHNMLYWSDQSYWGLGVSAHSYFNNVGPWGTRFWNPAKHRDYMSQVQALNNAEKPFYEVLPPELVETLAVNESLTDFCHTQLRKVTGLSMEQLIKKYGDSVANIVLLRLEKLLQLGWVERAALHFRLSSVGRPLANQVFLELTFLPEDL